MSKLYGFMHICTITHWKEIVSEQFETIKNSGLLDVMSGIFCGVVGDEPFEPPHPKIQVIYKSPDIYEYEFATLKPLHNFCIENPDAKVFYIHSKGVTNKGGDIRGPGPKRKLFVAEWRRFMEHMLLVRHKNVLKLLEKADICGVNWRMNHRPPYPAGNFWWANAKYVATLPDITQEFAKNRANAEFWLGRGKGIAANMWNSYKNHYAGGYKEEEYVDKTQPIQFYRFGDNKSEPDYFMEITI